MSPPLVVAHGGAGNVPEVKDGCERACAAALEALARGASALDAAVAGCVVLEDDPRMNAGTGAVLRLDGKAQLDASVMDAAGFGAVAVVEGWKNPVKLARAVYDSPHMLIAGPGGDELAARLGLEPALPISDAQRARHAARMKNLDNEPRWRTLYGGVDPRIWRDVAAGDGGPGDVEPGDPMRGAAARPPRGACDTVGVAVRDAGGAFALASSTGGIWCAIRGRVGDTPIPGAGLYVGPAGAVAATGVGEAIWQDMVSLRVHDAMAGGLSAQAAVDQALASFRARHAGVDVGVVAVDARGGGGGSTATMPWAEAQGG